MQKLIDKIKAIPKGEGALPFSVYRSVEEQRMLNVPVVKPLLILVLSGSKKLGVGSDVNCPSGSFVFLSNMPNVAMRNIPNNVEYFALLIEFDYSDFSAFEYKRGGTDTYFHGPIEPSLEFSLLQFVEWAAVSPPGLWHLRRQEILHVLASLGYDQVNSVMKPPTLSHEVYTIIQANLTKDLDSNAISSMLAMSDSTLRRKLNAEGDNLQAIKDRAKLGHGLHLVQTSEQPIGLIAEQCGYSSQSRFTDKFKQLFNITPTALRKTILSDSGK